jgi:hypothetical protein
VGLIPKSNLKLNRGDYAFLRRDDGRFAILVFIAPVDGMRSAFWGAILAVVCRVASLPNSATLPVSTMALMHIGVFAHNDAPIVGNLDARLDQPDIQGRLLATRQRNRVLGWAAVARVAGELRSPESRG